MLFLDMRRYCSTFRNILVGYSCNAPHESWGDNWSTVATMVFLRIWSRRFVA
jgi:hypothetical protein